MKKVTLLIATFLLVFVFPTSYAHARTYSQAQKREMFRKFERYMNNAYENYVFYKHFIQSNNFTLSDYNGAQLYGFGDGVNKFFTINYGSFSNVMLSLLSHHGSMSLSQNYSSLLLSILRTIGTCKNQVDFAYLFFSIKPVSHPILCRIMHYGNYAIHRGEIEDSLTFSRLYLSILTNDMTGRLGHGCYYNKAQLSRIIYDFETQNCSDLRKIEEDQKSEATEALVRMECYNSFYEPSKSLAHNYISNAPSIFSRADLKMYARKINRDLKNHYCAPFAHH